MPVNAFKWKHFAGEMILLNVRWYVKYALSYKNLEERFCCKNNFTAFLGYNYCFLYHY